VVQHVTVERLLLSSNSKLAMQRTRAGLTAIKTA